MIKKRSFSTVAAVVMAVLLLPASAFAAWHLLKPNEVADKLENTALSEAFDSASAININKSVASGDYTFTLLGIVSGKDISDQSTDGEIQSDRSYVVTAIQKADGTPMPSFQEEGFAPFYISPYVKGQKPWQVNANTLGGGSSEILVDGVLYCLVEFDNITMFADSGVYIGIIDGRLPNSQAFLIDEQTGELNVNPNYSGTSVLFDLPIDRSLADPEKAQAFLHELLGDIVQPVPKSEDSSIGRDDSSVFVPDNTESAAADISQNSEDTSPGSFTLDVGKGLVSQKEMTKTEYTQWMKKQSSESREVYESYLEYFDQGRTVTVYTYDDGSIAIQAND